MRLPSFVSTPLSWLSSAVAWYRVNRQNIATLFVEFGTVVTLVLGMLGYKVPAKVVEQPPAPVVVTPPEPGPWVPPEPKPGPFRGEES